MSKKALGKFLETDKDVIASNVRLGMFVKADEETRSIPTERLFPITIKLNEAVSQLKEPKLRGRAAKPSTLKKRGEDTASGKKIAVMTGAMDHTLPAGK